MSCCCEGNQGPTPSEPIPAGTVAGQLLVWNGGAWVAQSEGTLAGQVLTWNGVTWVPDTIAAASIDPGAVNTVLWTGAGPAVSWTGDPWVSSSLAIGAIPASAGALRLPNASFIRGRNAVNTLDIDIVQLNGSNNLLFGNDVTSVVDVRALTNTRTFSAGVQTSQLGRSSADFIRMGGTLYASVGMIRTVNAPTGGALVCRNAADSADIVAITVNSSNQVVLASSGITTVVTSALQVNSGTTLAGTITFTAATVSPSITQGVDASASVTGDLFLSASQDVSGNTATIGGARTDRAGDATGTGGTHTGGAYLSRGGDATGAAGTRRGGAWDARPGSGATAGGALTLRNGANAARVQIDDTGLGFFAAAPVAQQTITGSRGGNAALADLLTKLALTGLIIDGTTA